MHKECLEPLEKLELAVDLVSLEYTECGTANSEEVVDFLIE